MEDNENVYIVPFKAYRVIKYLCTIALPALAVFYNLLAPAWGWPYQTQVVTTVNATALFLGTLIGVSQATATPKEVEPDVERTSGTDGDGE